MTFQFIQQVFIKLFVVIDPFSVVPMFVMLTRNEPWITRKYTAIKACMIATCVLVLFAFLGDKLFKWLSVSESAFNIAGGGLLLLAAAEMVLAKHSGLHATTVDENKEALTRDDISVFPLAFPLIAGPGALTTVVMVMRQAEKVGFMAQVNVAVIVCFVLLLTYVTMRLGEYLMAFLGVIGTNVLTRVFGIILAAMAVQIMINGFLSIVPSL